MTPEPEAREARRAARRRWGVVAALFIAGEAMVLVSHPKEVQAVMRTVYMTLWEYAPKPAGYIPPDRFKPRP